MSTLDNHPPQPGPPGLLNRARRLGGYAFWHSAGLMLPLALDRLIICPVLNEHFGKEIFGSFIWILGIMNLFGNIGANGFAILLMRNLARESLDTGRRMMRTALLLSAVLSGAILVAASFGSYAIADETVRANATALYIPLGLFALMRSFELIVLANLRVKRRFINLFTVKVVEAIVLVAILFLAPGKNLALISTIYLLSALASLPVGIWGCRELIGSGRWWDSQSAKWLMAGWFAGAMLTILDQTQVYASRIILGAFSGGGQVAVLYAGTSIGALFTFPAGTLGALVLSLLAGRKTFILTGRRGYHYVLVVGALAVGTGLLSYLLGRLIIANRYPQLVSETLVFYHWIAVSNGGRTVLALMRPVGVRYGHLVHVSLLSAATVALQLGALAVMVPLAQARGAAISLAASSTLSAVLWMLYFNKLRRHAEQEGLDQIEPPE